MLERSNHPMKKVIITVQGRVQGVGFRYHTKLMADKVGVKGTAENQIDGSVLIKVSASTDKIDSFIDSIENNRPTFSRIDSIHIVENNDLPEFSSFKVIH